MQEIVTWYRYIGLAKKIHPKLVFESVFKEYSDYFKELEKDSLDRQYWEDLVFVHKGKNFGLHFMVNMIAVPESEYNF